MAPKDPSNLHIHQVFPDSFDATLEVMVKNVYGTFRYYPLNDQAQHLSRIAGTETLTPEVLKIAKQMGFKVNMVHFIPQEPKLNA